MRIEKTPDSPYYIATQNGREYLGYSHFEAMSRAIAGEWRSVKPSLKKRVSNLLAWPFKLFKK